MSLDDWLKSGWLVEHETSRREIADLLGVIARDLADCRVSGLSRDWQFNIAHNAALLIATAALAACGYRASREAHHYRTIQSLAYTLNIEAETIAHLDACRKKRNISDYERVGTVSDQEAQELVALVGRLHTKLSRWLETDHRHLL
jgi:hypothetical protein